MKEKMKKYFFPIFLTVLLFIVLGFEIYLLRLPPEQIPTRFIIVSLFVINIISIITLGFFVIRSIFRLYLEKHREVPGYRFRIKIVTIFVGLVLIPSALLFIAFSGVLESSIERIFSKSNREVISKTIDTVKSFYDFEKARLLKFAEDFKEGKIKGLPDGISVERLKNPREDMPESIRDAFQGKKSTQVISSSDGDVIIAALPEKQGVIVLKMSIPSYVTKKVEEVKAYHEEYLKMGSFRKAVKSNYFMFLGFLSLIIIFLALWASLKISQEITNPLKELVQATQRVAEGDLKVKILTKSSDEIGILVNSFNEMISKLDKAYVELSERHILLERIFSNITSGIIFVGDSGKIFKINKAGEEILQISAEKLQGRHYSEILEFVESDELKEFIKKLSQERIYEISKDLNIKIKGRNKMIKARIVSLREFEESEATGILVVFDDITDIVKAQQAVAWEEVARRLAHEIKNPLTPIKLATERLVKKWKNKDEEFDKVFEKSTQRIISEVESLKNLIDAFQKLGKLPEIKKEPVNPIDLIQDVIELYKGYKDVKINFISDGEIKPVLLDYQEFKRVLINIIDNAIKAMNAKGEITISVKLNNSLQIEIADTGPGVDDEIKEKLFLPYFSKTKEGTGLGLTIARKIITEHDGRIFVMDNKPSGTIFKIEVPL
ncbi:sensor histidine kinase [Thermodesulfovibrio yellowstonii]|uniref:sensor histidine kinase n=1 Tax=Thermodesulfovibrio yellowstonii TaxID=28262 RepID=UPI0024B32881|nr:ATP-binding protein [Thermodesulfovibrio yellowstonii]MDI6865840.1 ATP-binding protein [Thermodesulfovibrio yellowstonii]